MTAPGWWAEKFMELHGIPSAEAFGTPGIAISGDTFLRSIASAEAFGTLSVGSKLVLTGIGSAEAFGTMKINENMGLTGIASAETFGSLTARPVVGLAGIPSTEAFGALQVRSMAFDATAGGSAGNAPFSTSTASWTQNIAVDANVAFVLFEGYADNTITVFGASCGSSGMTPVPGASISIDSFRTLTLFKLDNPPTGNNIAFTASIGGFGNNIAVRGISFTYRNAGALGAAATTTGAGTSMSQLIANTQGSIVLQCFAYNTTGAFSAYNQTLRVNEGTNYGMGIGDAKGVVGNLTFSATIPSSNWGSIIVPLMM